MLVTRDSMASGALSARVRPLRVGETVNRGRAHQVGQHVGEQFSGHGLTVALRVSGAADGRDDGGDLLANVPGRGGDVLRRGAGCWPGWRSRCRSARRSATSWGARPG